MGTPAPVAPCSYRAEAARRWLRFLSGALEDALGGHHNSETSRTTAGGTGWPSAHLGLLLLLSPHSTPAGCTAPSCSRPNSAVHSLFPHTVRRHHRAGDLERAANSNGPACVLSWLETLLLGPRPLPSCPHHLGQDIHCQAPPGRDIHLQHQEEDTPW